jgi:hypothetical protein
LAFWEGEQVDGTDFSVLGSAMQVDHAVLQRVKPQLPPGLPIVNVKRRLAVQFIPRAAYRLQRNPPSRFCVAWVHAAK